MNITKRQLRKMIKEEQLKLLDEAAMGMDPSSAFIYDGIFDAVIELLTQESMVSGLDLSDPNTAATVAEALKDVGNQLVNDARLAPVREAVRAQRTRKGKYQYNEAMSSQIAAKTGRVARAMGGGYLPLTQKAKQWLAWGEGYGLNPEEDNEGQLLFFFDLNDDVDGSIEREAERMGGDLQPAGYAQDGNMVIYTGEYTSEISLGEELR